MSSALPSGLGIRRTTYLLAAAALAGVASAVAPGATGIAGLALLFCLTAVLQAALLFSGRLILPCALVALGSVAVFPKTLGLADFTLAEPLMIPFLAGSLLFFGFGKGRLRSAPKAFLTFYIAFVVLNLIGSFRPDVELRSAVDEVLRYTEILVIGLAVYSFATEAPLQFRASYLLACSVATGLLTYRALVNPGVENLLALKPLQMGELPLLVALVLPLAVRLPGSRGLVVVLLLAATTFISGTRGAWLEIALVILVYMFLERRGSVSPFMRHAAVAAVIIAIGASLLVPQFRERISNLLVAGDQSSNDRIELLRASSDAFMAHPMTGIGPGNFGVWLTSVDTTSRPFVDNINNQPDDPHSVPFKTAAELGLPGLVLLIAWLGALVPRAVAPRLPASMNAYSTGIRLSALAFAMTLLVSPAFGGIERLLVGTYLGVVLAARNTDWGTNE